MRAGEAGEAPSGGDQRIGRSTIEEIDVERDTQVPEVHGAAEARARAGEPARRRRRSPSSAASTRSPRRCCGAGAIRCWRPAPSAWPARQERSRGRRAAQADRRARAGAGPQDLRGWRSWETLSGVGVSQRVARPASSSPPGIARRSWRASADQPPGDLPRPEAAARAGVAERGRRPTRSRPRSSPRPRRNPTDGYRHGRGVGAAPARAARQPQARAAGDARARADPAPPPAGASAPARVLPRRAPRSALAPGHDLGLGRRARLGLPDRRDRLLHARDRRLAPRDPLPRPARRSR